MSRYRPNVCAVVTDAAGERVLVFRRADGLLGEQRWQFPQGGLEPGESPRDGILRELAEEIGTDQVDIVAQAPDPIRYDFPEHIRAQIPAAKSGYDGQEQVWFLVRLRGGTESINFNHRPAEFDAFRWTTPAEALQGMVDFKVRAYRQGLTALGLLPAEDGNSGEDEE